MKLKLDENGNVVVQDGKPVYVHEDGKEIAFDAPAAVSKIKQVSNDRDDLKEQLAAAKKTVDKIGDLDIDEAKQALETVKNLDDKKLIDAKEIDTLKRQMSETFEADKKQLLKQHEDKVAELQTTISAQKDTVFQLMVSGEFAKSDYFTGENAKTNLPPEVASEYFGKFFKIEGEGKDARAVGYLNGEKILSRERYGEPAGFNEAIATIIETSPIKDKILISKGGGSGDPGNQGGGSSTTIKSDDHEAFGANLEAIAKGEVEVK